MVTAMAHVLLACAMGSHLPAFHPIHAARVEITVSNRGELSAVVRVYRDDFPPGEDPKTITAYLARTLVLTRRDGTRVALQLSNITREGDRLRIALAGTMPNPVDHGSVQATLLQERFPDQVNVVVAHVAGRDGQLVFLKGDRAQSLP